MNNRYANNEDEYDFCVFVWGKLTMYSYVRTNNQYYQVKVNPDGTYCLSPFGPTDTYINRGIFCSKTPVKSIISRHCLLKCVSRNIYYISVCQMSFKSGLTIFSFLRPNSQCANRFKYIYIYLPCVWVYYMYIPVQAFYLVFGIIWGTIIKNIEMNLYNMNKFWHI